MQKYKNVYRKWEGQIYDGPHPTHIPVGSSDVIPSQQSVPGYCILCPMTRVIPSRYELRRHFRHLHVKYGITVQNTNIMACKCSQMKNHGSDGTVRNLHFHCHKCHWPRTQWIQMYGHYTTQHNFRPEEVAHLQVGPRESRCRQREANRNRAKPKSKGKPARNPRKGSKKW